MLPPAVCAWLPQPAHAHMTRSQEEREKKKAKRLHSDVRCIGLSSRTFPHALAHGCAHALSLPGRNGRGTDEAAAGALPEGACLPARPWSAGQHLSAVLGGRGRHRPASKCRNAPAPFPSRRTPKMASHWCVTLTDRPTRTAPHPLPKPFTSFWGYMWGHFAHLWGVLLPCHTPGYIGV